MIPIYIVNETKRHYLFIDPDRFDSSNPNVLILSGWMSLFDPKSAINRNHLEDWSGDRVIVTIEPPQGMVDMTDDFGKSLFQHFINHGISEEIQSVMQSGVDGVGAVMASVKHPS